MRGLERLERAMERARSRGILKGHLERMRTSV
jgi:hypothetical protein